jgi:hypothetical protein
MFDREDIIRRLAREIAQSHRPTAREIATAREIDPRPAAEELARAAVCLVCDRPSSFWAEMTDRLCQLAMPELGGFARQR